MHIYKYKHKKKILHMALLNVHMYTYEYINAAFEVAR